MEYKVNVTRTIHKNKEVEVEADNPEEAKKKAAEWAKHHDWSDEISQSSLNKIGDPVYEGPTMTMTIQSLIDGCLYCVKTAIFDDAAPHQLFKVLAHRPGIPQDKQWFQAGEFEVFRPYKDDAVNNLLKAFISTLESEYPASRENVVSRLGNMGFTDRQINDAMRSYTRYND